MNYVRYSHGCVVADNILWVVGTVSEIEIININTTDIYSAEWSVYSNFSISDNLIAFGVVSTHVISQSDCQWFGYEGTLCNDHSIYIVGGWIGDFDSGHNSDTVYIINTEWGNMTNDTLAFGVSAISTVLAVGSIYGFGGWNATSSWRDGHSRCILMRHDLLRKCDCVISTELLSMFSEILTLQSTDHEQL